jgi:hypothetical protein
MGSGHAITRHTCVQGAWSARRWAPPCRSAAAVADPEGPGSGWRGSPASWAGARATPIPRAPPSPWIPKRINPRVDPEVIEDGGEVPLPRMQRPFELRLTYEARGIMRSPIDRLIHLSQYLKRNAAKRIHQTSQTDAERKRITICAFLARNCLSDHNSSSRYSCFFSWTNRENKKAL